MCGYPILDYPGWDDACYCPESSLSYADGQGQRAAFHPLHKALCDRASAFDTLIRQKGGNFPI
ncbi:Glycoside hydrolase [Pseudomonas syringae pv. ribicola]|uniref:Glycoside hydrolase n=1 Tax=Pseudomonas syringae pv. ribicola TaxID=55398 RepID=A0A3M2W6R5_PSESI|nr:Glycoside hydrolase [Pseudomonas syringae pv. ribicola]